MSNRRAFIAGNWKMYKTGGEALAFIDELNKLIKDVVDTDVVVAPPLTALALVADRIKGTSIQLAAQNVHWESEGAYTGEVSPDMLVSAGCYYVLIGHSERRQYFGETDATVNKKIKAALAHRLSPVFCIGETLAEREAGNTFSVLSRQIKDGLSGISPADIKQIIVAYEPVWAIGTGKTASNEQAQDAHAFIRGELAECCGKDIANTGRILYGGSVKPSNIGGLMVLPDVDGALVGGASLVASTFAEIVRCAKV
ncbi:MAG: triose-phosphate isomerase [Pseudomonadota bacterium]